MKVADAVILIFVGIEYTGACSTLQYNSGTSVRIKPRRVENVCLILSCHRQSAVQSLSTIFGTEPRRHHVYSSKDLHSSKDLLHKS